MSTLGFIPPPVVPLVPAAANAIVPTGGLLAGAALGAKAGAVLGPKGLLAGALVGGALGLILLTPKELAPGTLPGLDPGLNPAANPNTDPIYPSGTLTAGDPSPGAPSVYFNGRYRKIRTATTNYDCRYPDRPSYESPEFEGSPSSWAFTGRAVEIKQNAFKSGPVCNPDGYFDDFLIRIVGTNLDGSTTTIKSEAARNGTWYNGVGTIGDVGTSYIEIESFFADQTEIDVGIQTAVQPERSPKPRPTPIPIEPLTTDPDVSPIFVPAPSTPTLPTPIPEIPSIAPPVSTPSRPSTLPLPLPSPSPQPITPSQVPAVSLPTLPDGSIAPAPKPEVVTTPKDAHFPVPGGKPVTSGGARPSPAAIANEIGRIEQKAANILNGQSKIDIPLGPILYLLEQILGNQEQEFPGTTYTLSGVCESPDDEGNQPVFSTPIGDQPGLDAVITRVDALQYLLQAHLGYKTPTCAPEPTPIEGDYRTISFRSDETSPFGKSRLRKRLRYRGSEGVELSTLVDHWKDFSWESGAIRVRHVGASWGAPEVWAASESEGKRVLLHAAREAGIDPDQVGRWSTRSSNSSRLGVSDTMRVDTTGGYYWITSRDGSDQRPIVAKT